MRQAIYGRVSTQDQDGSAQLARLSRWAREDGRDVVLSLTDEATGRNMLRPGLEKILQEARAHRVQAVAVTRLDRWTRSLIDLNSTLQELRELGVEWYAVDQGIRISPDRADATSRFQLNVIGAAAEWESSIISERTAEALAYRKSRGVRLGRPPIHAITEDQVEEGARLRLEREMGWGELTQQLGLPRGARTTLRSRILDILRKGGRDRSSTGGSP